MNKTKIEYVQYTSNPIRPEIIATGKRKGWFCTKVSAGCANCYAERMNRRCSPSGAGIGNGLAFTGANEGRVRFVLDEDVLRKIIHSRAPAGSRVFVADMTDLFHPLIPFEMIDAVWAAMALRPDLTFMLLTKRPARMREYLTHRSRAGIIQTREFDLDRPIVSDRDEIAEWYMAHPMTWPLPNVQLGVTAEDQATADERIPILLATPAAVRFVSYEPALGPVDFSTYLHCPCGGNICSHKASLDGLIVGGESGPGARPAQIEWFESVRDQCKNAQVPFFMKQLCEGGKPVLIPDRLNIRELP